MLFRNFPYIVYAQANGQKDVLTNIMTRVYHKIGFDDEKALYTHYNIIDGERPEDVAEKAYGSPDYHWVILMFNDIIDPYYDWCLSQSNLLKYTKAAYDDINDIHHYVDSDGYINHENDGTPVTNFQYEFDRNETKRQIHVLDNKFLQVFLDEHAKALYS